MMWKQVHYVKYNRLIHLLPNIPLEQVFTEDIYVDDDLGVIVYSPKGWGSSHYYSNIDDYKQKRFQYVVNDMETDILIVDICEI